MKYLNFYFILPVLSGLLLVSCGKKNGISAVVDPPGPVKTIKYIDTLPISTPMKHPGGLHTAEDFTRIKAKVNEGAEPWISGWNKLIANSHARLTYAANPTVKIIRGGNTIWEPEPDNYSRAFNDVAAAYQCAIRWKVSGDMAYAQKSIQILNAWASTCVSINGDGNASLAAGIYGYQFAVTGELMRDYSGWAATDFKAYQDWMLKVFYSVNHDFLVRHHDTCPGHYWANWDLCNLASTMAIGILTDKRAIYNEAVNYLQRGIGNGNLLKAINHVFTGADAGFAQLQESGRDQGHATLVISLIGVISELAWQQGDDFYSFNDNQFLKACEHTAKYNVAKLDVPFRPYQYDNCRTMETLDKISPTARGEIRPMWALPYNHYVKRKGLVAPYTLMGVNSTFPDGGGGDYSPNSGGYDQLGFGTLLYSLP